MSDATDKITALKNIILARADGQRVAILNDARNEAQEWVQKETEKLERETQFVIQDAKSRSEEIHRRQILAAERTQSVETLRLQNRLLTTLLEQFQDGLVKLRDRSDYSNLIAGVLVKGVTQLNEPSVLFRLATLDAPLATDILKRAQAKCPGVKITFDDNPAPILGGCWVFSENRKKQVNLDWQSYTLDASDKLAERLATVL